jgi:hypothetical protein
MQLLSRLTSTLRPRSASGVPLASGSRISPLRIE